MPEFLLFFFASLLGILAVRLLDYLGARLFMEGCSCPCVAKGTACPLCGRVR